MESSATPPFEQQWRSAFQGAEASLPVYAWSGIEQALNRMENESSRRNVVYYQRLAAALLILAIVSASLFVWQWKNVPENQQSAIRALEGPASQPGAETKTPDSGQDLKLAGPVTEKKKASIPSINQTQMAISSIVQQEQPGNLNENDNLNIAENHANPTAIVNEEDNEKSSINLESSKSLTPGEEKELVKKLLGEGDAIVPEKKNPYKTLWGAVAIAGGSYTPDLAPAASAASNMPSYPNYLSVAKNSSGNQATTGTSYSFGLMMGKQLTKHWILQTGITYLKQNVDFESSVVTNSANGLVVYDVNAAIPAGSLPNYVLTNPYTINSMTEYLSLPVQVGYVLIDRKFGLAINSGVSTDLFLRNTLTDQSGNYAGAAGQDSAYRTISWSGVTNTELSMYVGGNLKLSIVPGARYSFSNTMNENYGYQRPFILDLGFRCRYTFK